MRTSQQTGAKQWYGKAMSPGHFYSVILHVEDTIVFAKAHMNTKEVVTIYWYEAAQYLPMMYLFNTPKALDAFPFNTSQMPFVDFIGLYQPKIIDYTYINPKKEK